MAKESDDSIGKNQDPISLIGSIIPTSYVAWKFAKRVLINLPRLKSACNRWIICLHLISRMVIDWNVNLPSIGRIMRCRPTVCASFHRRVGWKRCFFYPRVVKPTASDPFRLQPTPSDNLIDHKQTVIDIWIWFEAVETGGIEFVIHRR